MPKTSGRSPRPSTIEDPFAEILESWRLWLLGALIGALLAGGAFAIAPPDYRARATVVVDNNLEEAWTFFPDRQLFNFLQRETERLVELAWSDEVMQMVALASNEQSIGELRVRVLQLSHPSDGGWHFYADHRDSNIAETLASTWAQAFVDAARAAVQASPELQLARQELDGALSSGANQEEIEQITERIAELAEHTKGISPFVELYVGQADDLPVERRVSQGTYLLVGSTVGALALPLWSVLRAEPKRSRQ